MVEGDIYKDRWNMGGLALVTVWITIILESNYVFLFFFFCSAAIVDFVNCEQCIRALFTVLQITLFSNFFIKNGSHSTIYIFKNYFATVFSISIFSFSKNKLNPNTPLVYKDTLMLARYSKGRLADNSLILHIDIIIRKYYHTYFESIHAFYIWFWNNIE